MSRLWILIKRETLENVRQRWLLFSMATLFLIISAVCLAVLSNLDRVVGHEAEAARFQHFMEVMGVGLDDPLGQVATLTVATLEILIFAQLGSLTAVLAGHAGIHDRQCGTLPFLLLAPVRRFELLAGKVLGALTVPLAIYLVIGGASSVLAAGRISAAGQLAYLPPSPGWIAAFLVAAPAWSIVIGTACVLISAAARDVRTAQQAAWVIVFVAALVLSPLLYALMPLGAWPQIVLGIVGLVVSAVSLAIGSFALGRELTR